MYKNKKEVLKDYPELDLTKQGDFIIKKDYINNYEIIDFHCHLFAGLSKLFPKLLRREKNKQVSLFNKSCFPFTMGLFDMNEVCFTHYPKKTLSIEGLITKYKLIFGGFVVSYATSQRLISDMKLNNISKSVVLQITPPEVNSMTEMKNITDKYIELITFGSIHPHDTDIDNKIKDYLEAGIKGWKLNPHVAGFKINSKESITLIKKLSETKLPIISCSGLGVPDRILNTKMLSKGLRKNQETQTIKDFIEVLEEIPNTKFIFAHAGGYEIDELIELMKKYPNTYTDISIQPSKNITKLINSIGSERILFGTDYPFINHSLSIVSVLRATSKEQDRINIFSKNARNILNL